MKKLISLNIVFLLSLCRIFSFGSFDDAIESSRTPESEQEEDSHKKTEPSSSSSTSSGEDLCSSLAGDICGPFCEAGCQTCTEVLVDTWLEYQTMNYPPYPHAKDVPASRKQRFSVSTSFLWLKDLGIGNISSFNCMLYPLIGVFAENLFLYDNINHEGNMGNVTAGLQIPVMQISFADLFIRAGCTRWYNDTHPLLKDFSFLFGVEYRLLPPVKPVTVRARAEWQFFDDDVYIFEGDVEAGVFIQRAEVFAGWKHLCVGNTRAKSTTDNWDGISSGVRIHF